MKHYLSPTNQIFAYELDGSQDHLIPEDYTTITDSEAQGRFRQGNPETCGSFPIQ
jgi:hypothetical protein